MHLGVCSKKGILVKNSESLENFHKIKTIVFDKTGTLTNGMLSISKIFNYSNEEELAIIKHVASIESKSEHPIAKGIVEYSKNKNIELENVKEFKGVAGFRSLC